MSAIMGITFVVWILWAALFCLGLCSAAARPIPEPAPTNGHHHSRRQSYETITGESAHLDRSDSRSWTASNFVRYRRQLFSGPAGERFSQWRRVLTDEAMKIHAPFRNHLRRL